jgi:hypothetical protein
MVVKHNIFKYRVLAWFKYYRQFNTCNMYDIYRDFSLAVTVEKSIQKAKRLLSYLTLISKLKVTYCECPLYVI